MPKRMTREQLEDTIAQIKATHRAGVTSGNGDGERITQPVRLQFSAIQRIRSAMEERMIGVYEAAVNEGLSDEAVLKRLRKECGPHKSITFLNCMPHIDKEGAYCMSPQERMITSSMIKALMPNSRDVPWWGWDDYDEFLRERVEAKRYNGRMRTRRFREKQKMLKKAEEAGE